MKIKVLGTGTSVPSLSRSSSAYLVSEKSHAVLVDIGPATVRRLLEFGYAVNDVDVIILTHFHVDHSADLSTFLFACNYGITPRIKPLTIVGGKGFPGFFKNLTRVYPWIVPKSYELTLKTMKRGTVEIEGTRIETREVEHNKESIGVRVRGGGDVTFSGDTDYSKDFIRLARGTDLLVVECSFPERKVNGHLNFETLERMVGEIKPGRVLISHLYPEWDSYRGVLHHPYLIGEDGLEIDL